MSEPASPGDGSSLINVPQAAAHLGISTRGLRRLIAQGRIPHFRVGGQLRFDLAEVRAALREEVSP